MPEGATLREKVCLSCGKTFYCPYGFSLGRWNRATFCSRKCRGEFRTKESVHTKECPICGDAFKVHACHLSERVCCSMKCSAEYKHRTYKRGEHSHSWRGGKTPQLDTLRNSFEYKVWRNSVFERDDYTCVLCGARGSRLNADHIRPFSTFIAGRFDVDNGRTLCEPCHRKTDTYGFHNRKKFIGEICKH